MRFSASRSGYVAQERQDPTKQHNRLSATATSTTVSALSGHRHRVFGRPLLGGEADLLFHNIRLANENRSWREADILQNTSVS
jgi:hypothetical protein